MASGGGSPTDRAARAVGKNGSLFSAGARYRFASRRPRRFPAYNTDNTTTSGARTTTKCSQRRARWPGARAWARARDAVSDAIAIGRFEARCPAGMAENDAHGTNQGDDED